MCSTVMQETYFEKMSRHDPLPTNLLIFVFASFKGYLDV